MQAERTQLYADLRQLVFHAGKQFPQTQFFLSQDPDFPFVTGQGLWEACGQFGSWISRRGQTGCHIALLGPNGAAWLTCFFAVISSGCAVVPLYYGAPLEDQSYCLQKSDSVILLYDKRCETDAVALRDALPALEIFEMHCLLYNLDSVGAVTFPPLQPDVLCALYFTSGTTEQSRCVMLTHRNLGAMVSAAMPLLPLSPKDTGLSIMPPSHTFEMMTNIVGALHCGGTLYINQSLRTVKANLKKCQPTIVVTVPLLLQTLKKEILTQVRRRGKTEQFEKALRISLKFRRRGIDISHKLFAEVYETLGSNLRYFICGGAALDPELITFFDGLGIIVLQGYGITECSPIVSCNTPEYNHPGSIGRVFPSCEVQIINGEICVRAARASPADIITTLKPPPPRFRTAGSTPETSATSTPTDTSITTDGAKISSSSPTARTSRPRRSSRSSTASRAFWTPWSMSETAASPPRSGRIRTCFRIARASGTRLVM
ncbi:MAG: AMP-binding protein [Oscillospiraceae bacterium]|nr:AMP-binding protein [Oscillospiraceae bacterium]